MNEEFYSKLEMCFGVSHEDAVELVKMDLNAFMEAMPTALNFNKMSLEELYFTFVLCHAIAKRKSVSAPETMGEVKTDTLVKVLIDSGWENDEASSKLSITQMFGDTKAISNIQYTEVEARICITVNDQNKEMSVPKTVLMRDPVNIQIWVDEKIEDIVLEFSDASSQARIMLRSNFSRQDNSWVRTVKHGMYMKVTHTVDFAMKNATIIITDGVHNLEKPYKISDEFTSIVAIPDLLEKKEIALLHEWSQVGKK